MRKSSVALVLWLAGALLAPAGAQPAATVPSPAAQITATATRTPPRVRLVATGGTISNRRGGRLTADELVASVPGLEEVATVQSEQFANAASAALTLDQWLALSKRINELFRNESDLAGVVVTSGTDTLEELAYFLHLTVRDTRPVVVTGSMRNPSQVGYEGQANLLAAVRVAAEPAAVGRGPLGVVDSDRVVFRRAAAGRHSAESEFDVSRIAALPRVDAFLVYQDAPGDLIRAAIDLGARGIVLATAGAGATSGTQGAAVIYAREKGVPVVSTTRAGTGRIAGRNPGGGQGRIAAGDLSAIKARILLMLALTRTSDPAELQRIFDEY